MKHRAACSSPTVYFYFRYKPRETLFCLLLLNKEYSVVSINFGLLIVVTDQIAKLRQAVIKDITELKLERK